MHFDFIMVVWGESFTDLFLNVILPNEMTPGNLLHFKDRKNATYKIYTTNRDAETIRRSAIFKQLDEVMGTEIISIDSLIAAHPKTHYALTAAHKRAIASPSDPGNTGFVFLCPDAIVSEGCFARIEQLAQEGKRAVMVPGMRLVKESFISAYRGRHFESPTCAPIKPRELVSLAMKNLHALSLCLFWDSPNFGIVPSHMYWKVGTDGVLLRCFHLHPLFVKPASSAAAPTTTIDGDYLLHACPNSREIHIVEDSDEMAVFELSPQARRDYLPVKNGEIATRRPGIFYISRWAVYHTDSHHRHFVHHQLRVHASNLHAEWQTVEAQAEKTVQAVLRLYAICRFLCPIPDFARSAIQDVRSRLRIRTRLRQLWAAWSSGRRTAPSCDQKEEPLLDLP